MAARIDPNWINLMRGKIGGGEFKSEILSYNAASQWLIAYLASLEIPVQVTNLGAGVKRITVAEHVCEHCKGKGYE